MSMHDQFLADLLQTPDDRMLRGVYADWCEDNDLSECAACLRWMASANKRPLRDFNFENDSAAMQIILDSKVSLVLAPFEMSSKVWITAADVDALKGLSPVLDWLAGPAVDWLGVWKRSFGVDGFNPFETLAVAVVTSPRLVSCEMIPVHIEELPDDTSVTGDQNSKPYLLVSAKIQSAHFASYCYEAKPEFKTDLMRRLLNAP